MVYDRVVQLYLLRAATASYHLVAGRNTGACTRDWYGLRHFRRNVGRLLDSGGLRDIRQVANMINCPITHKSLNLDIEITLSHNRK